MAKYAKGKSWDLNPNRMLKRLAKHCIDNKQSIHTITNPPWSFYKTQMSFDTSFADQANNIIAKGDSELEQIAIEALNDKTFNDRLWSKLVSNRTFTKDHLAIELEAKLDELLEAKNS